MPIIQVPDGATELDILGASDVVDYIQTLGWPTLHINYLSKLEATGKFPDPYLELSGRKGWLRAQVDQWWQERENKEQNKALDVAVQFAAGLDDKALREYLKQIEAKAKEARTAA